MIDHAEGTNLYDSDGNVYIDGVSSLWCNVHGHRHPADRRRRPQPSSAASPTRPCSASPTSRRSSSPSGSSRSRRPDSSRVFYSDSGSTAVEVALKMAFQFWAQRGETQRTGFICLENAYHGDTLGAVSVGGIDLFHSLYRPLLFDAWQRPRRRRRRISRSCSRAHGERVAAVIVEPLVQGAAGMLMQPAGYLRARPRAVRRARRAADLRRGRDRVRPHRRMFACEHEQRHARPDVRRQGAHRRLPAARRDARDASACTRASSAPSSDFRTFFHGHTYTGNPLACAAGIASLQAFEHEQHARAAGGRRSSCWQRLLAAPSRRAPGRRRGPSARVHGRDRADRAARAGAHGTPRDARRAPPRSDHPPARGRRRADAGAVDHRGRPAPAGRDHRGGDRRRDRRPPPPAAAAAA